MVIRKQFGFYFFNDAFDSDSDSGSNSSKMCQKLTRIRNQDSLGNGMDPPLVLGGGGGRGYSVSNNEKRSWHSVNYFASDPGSFRVNAQKRMRREIREQRKITEMIRQQNPSGRGGIFPQRTLNLYHSGPFSCSHVFDRRRISRGARIELFIWPPHFHSCSVANWLQAISCICGTG